MDYTALFNLLYSTEISEATKDEIINKINAGISESYEVKPIVGTYMELLDTLVFSTASESLIYNIIDEAFSQLSEEVINEVSNEWVKKKVGDSLKARQSAVDSANKSVKSGIIGLSQLNRQSQAQSNLEKGQQKAASIQARLNNRNQGAPAATPKSETSNNTGVMGKLKSAVGKVKNWADNVDKGPDHVGLSRLIGQEANRRNIGAETLRQQSTHKVTEAPKATEAPKTEEVKATEAPKAKKATKAKKVVEAPKTEEVKQPEIKATEAPKAKEVKTEVKANDAIKAAKKKVAKIVEPEAPKATEAPKAKKAPKTEEVKQPEVEAPKTEEAKVTEAPKAKKATKVKAEVKADDATKATKAAKVKADDATKVKDTVKAAKKKVAKVAAESTNTKEAPSEVKEIKQEATPKAEAEENKPQKSSMDTLRAKLARESANRRKDQERLLQTYTDRVKGMTARPGYDEKEVQDLNSRIEALKKELGQNQVKANEALSDLAILLLDTNISENCFVEVMEMVAANKANADKAKKRIEKEAGEAMDALHDDIAKGLPESPEKIENFSKIAKREEKFMKRYREKFGNNS